MKMNMSCIRVNETKAKANNKQLKDIWLAYVALLRTLIVIDYPQHRRYPQNHI